MSLTVGTDTYCTVAEADAYFAGRVQQAATWAALDPTVKEMALRMAALHLDGLYVWRGSVTDTTTPQTMNWPRKNIYDGEGRAIDSSTIPVKIKWSQAELGLQWAIADQLTPPPSAVTGAEAADVQMERLGPLERRYFKPTAYMWDLAEGRLRQKVYPLLDIYLQDLYSERKKGSGNVRLDL